MKIKIKTFGESFKEFEREELSLIQVKGKNGNWLNKYVVENDTELVELKKTDLKNDCKIKKVDDTLNKQRYELLISGKRLLSTRHKINKEQLKQSKYGLKFKSNQPDFDLFKFNSIIRMVIIK